jgi:hypothetical protein
MSAQWAKNKPIWARNEYRVFEGNFLENGPSDRKRMLRTTEVLAEDGR